MNIEYKFEAARLTNMGVPPHVLLVQYELVLE
jgi:hypothetical protein